MEITDQDATHTEDRSSAAVGYAACALLFVLALAGGAGLYVVAGWLR